MSSKVEVNGKIKRRTLLKVFPAIFVAAYIENLEATSISGYRSSATASAINLTADMTSITADSMMLTADNS